MAVVGGRGLWLGLWSCCCRRFRCRELFPPFTPRRCQPTGAGSLPSDLLSLSPQLSSLLAELRALTAKLHPFCFRHGSGFLSRLRL
jgi:hypothetical protein